jgi:hypothetical protein
MTARTRITRANGAAASVRSHDSGGKPASVELVHEHAQQKYTLAELEEEEQSLDRLRRWYRDLRNRDLLGTALTAEADERLKECARQFDGYAEAVYAHLGTPPPSS